MPGEHWRGRACDLDLDFMMTPGGRAAKWRSGLHWVDHGLFAFTVIFALGAVLGEQVAQLAEKLPE